MRSVPIPVSISRLWLPSMLLLMVFAVPCFSQADRSNKSDGDSQVSPPPVDETLEKIHIRDGFEIELVASEPLVKDPVAIDWGPEGRLWVAEMADYPLGKDGAMKQPGGRIRVLEDTDGDGGYDQSTVFLDRIRMPTGLMTWKDGVIVTAAPKIFFARDSDGDGEADETRPLFRGFKVGNPQLRINGLRWGLDNWIYGANGGHHSGYGEDTQVEVVATGETISLGSRDYRFQPESNRFDPQSGPSQFGRVRNDRGDWFGVQNTHPLWHYVLRDHYLRRNPHVAPPNPKNHLLPTSAELRPAKPPQERFHSERHAGRFTSASGISIYRGNLLFDGRAKREHAFACAPVHNLVYHAVLTPEGVSFSAKRANPEAEFDFLASESRFFRPVYTRTGPDGALWVVDMARYMIEHPRWLPDEAKKKLRPNYRTGERLGRIYRVYPEDRPPGQIPTMNGRSTGELVELFERTSGWVRDRAQQKLVTGDDVDRARAGDELKRLFRNSDRPMARLHALCTLDGIGKLEPGLLKQAMNDDHSAVRRNAVRIAESFADPSGAATRGNVMREALRLIDDPEPKVQQQLAFSLGAFKDAGNELKKKIGRTLGAMAVREADNKYMRASVLSAVPSHLPQVVDVVTAKGLDVTKPLILPLLSTAREKRDQMARLLRPVVAGRDERTYRPVQMRIVADWLDRIDGGGDPISSLKPDRNDALGEVLGKVESMMEAARGLVTNQNRSTKVRLSAARLLGRQPSHHDRDLNILKQLLDPTRPLELQRAAVDAAVRLPEKDASGLLLNTWDRLGPDVRKKILDTMLSRTGLTRNLLQAAKDGQLKLQPGASRRQRLLKHDRKELRRLAKQVLGTGESPSRQEVVDEYQPVLDLDGAAGRGKQVFKNTCATCHRVDDVGTNVGPDLRALTDTSPSALLQAILDPNRSVDPRYSSYVVKRKDGETLFGLIKKETSSSLTVVDASGREHQVLRSRIESMKRTGRSLMPEGLEKNLSKQDLADLIEFLQ